MSYQSIYTGSAIDASVDTTQQIFDLIYPIGAVYISVNDVSPANFIGGTWERIQDRFLVAAGDSYEAGTTGGIASHTHTTAGHTLTIDEMPSHYHGETMPVQGYSGWPSYTTPTYSVAINCNSGNNYFGPNTALYKTEVNACGATTNYAGGGTSHSHGDTGVSSNLPPYLSVYMWKRIA